MAIDRPGQRRYNIYKLQDQPRKELMTIPAKFRNLESEKQAIILGAALKEFAENGYDNASTNEIVKNARISKGSLFNYFGNKRKLYIYLLNYALEVVARLYAQIDFAERDVFQRIGKAGIQKLKTHKEFPYVFDFLASAQREESVEVKESIGEKINSIYESGLQKLYEGIDYSLFRVELDPQRAVEILNWTMFGFGEKQIQQLDNFKNSAKFGQNALEEWEIYSRILRNSFYKKECE